MKRMKRQPLTPDKYLSKAEVRALRKAIEDRALADAAKGRTIWVKCWMMIDLALQTGMRVSELASVKVGDFHLGREPFVQVVGKGHRERRIMLPTDLTKHLKHYIQVQQPELVVDAIRQVVQAVRDPENWAAPVATPTA